MSKKIDKTATTSKGARRPPVRTFGIGLRIKEAATRVGGVRKLSKMISLSPAQLNRVIGGSQPKIEDVVEIAAACDVSLDWLATGRESAGVLAARESFGVYGRDIIDTEPARTDAELLELVASRLLREIEKKGGRREPDRDARLIRALYEVCVNRAEKPDQETIDNIIRLIL